MTGKSRSSWVAVWTGAGGQVMISGVSGPHYSSLSECKEKNSGADIYAQISMVAGKLFIENQVK